VIGYTPEEMVGESALEYVHPDDREDGAEALEAILAGETPIVEFRFERPDGSWVILEGRGRNLQDDPLVDGVAIYTRDVTERVARTEQLERQREQLAALNDLNAVVRDINYAVIEQSTREEIEQLVVDRLAGSDSYRFAWIGSVDLRRGTVELHAEAGVENYLDDLDISIEEDTATGRGPTGTAVRTGEMQVINDVQSDPIYEPWRDRAEEYGYRSSAAIPIEYQGTLYGILNVYADRPNAFEGQERAVVGQLGGTIGHAINAIERKQALVSDEVLEVEFTAQQYLDSHGLAADAGTITFNRAVPIGGGDYVVYGTATEDALDTLDALTETLDHWEAVTVSGDGATRRFELDVSQPPIISRLAERGGRLHQAVIEDGAYHLVIHLPPSADVREFAEIVQDALPGAQLIAQRQASPEERSLPSLAGDLEDRLTVRQQNVLEAAYYAGFFEWPREKNGEEIAESLDVSAPTFHQHLRAGERKLLESVFEED
jgi:predicted DNA binding protein